MAGLYEVVGGHTAPPVAEHDPPWTTFVVTAWNDAEVVRRIAVHVVLASFVLMIAVPFTRTRAEDVRLAPVAPLTQVPSLPRMTSGVEATVYVTVVVAVRPTASVAVTVNIWPPGVVSIGAPLATVPVHPFGVARPEPPGSS